MIVLMYHALRDPALGLESNVDQYVVDIGDFERHATIIATSGLQPLYFGAADAPGLRMDSAGPIRVSMTFDDGDRSFLKAAHILADKGLAGTFFLIRDYCQTRKEFLKPPEIRELVSMGMEVGTHGCTHRPLTRLSGGELIRELKESKQWLEDIVSHPIDIMSAPGGFFGSREWEAAHKLGYRLIGTSAEGRSRLPIRGGLVPRICVRRHFADKTFVRILRGDKWWLLRRRMKKVLLALPKMLTGRSLPRQC